MKIPQSLTSHLTDTLRLMVSSNSAVYKELSGLLVNSWCNCPSDVIDKLMPVLTEQCIYDEVNPFLISLQKDCYVSCKLVFHLRCAKFYIGFGDSFREERYRC